MKKLLSVLLALMMLLSLTACKGKANTQDEEGVRMVDTSGSVGSVMLVCEHRLTIYYDKDGKVVAIADADDLAVHDELKDEACTVAISKLLKNADPPMVTSFLFLKQTRGSQTPSENFLQSLIAEAKLSISEPVVACSAEDQNDMGYFSPETAKAILAAYVGNPDGAVYVSSGTPIDGYYHVSITANGSTDEFTVGAYYGSVELSTDYVEEPEIYEELPDSFADDGANMDTTDNPEAETAE